MMEVVLTVIVVASIYATIENQLEEKAKADVQVKALEEERKKAREDLVRFGASDVVAYGARHGLVTGGELLGCARGIEGQAGGRLPGGTDAYCKRAGLGPASDSV